MQRLRSLGNNGLAILVLSSVIDSSSGLFSRLLPTDGFTTASGRGFFAFLFLMGVLVWRDGKSAFSSLLAVGKWGLIFAVLNANGMILNILSLKLTAVANFFMIFATAPFVAAIAGWLVLHEKLDRATLLAALAGVVGIAIMMFSGAKSGGLLGDFLALCVVFTYSSIILVVRHHKLDTLPAICVTTLLSGLAALPFSSATGLDTRSISILALFGFFQLGLGNMLIFRAVSRIPAAQSGLLGILSAAFAPAWVYIFLGEVPPHATLIGGAIILSAAAAHLVWTIYTSQQSQPDADAHMAL